MLRTGNYRGYLPLVGKANTALAAFKNLHVVIEAGTVTFNDMALVTMKQVPDEIVINDKVYTMVETVADKAALGIPDAAMNASADVGADMPVSCGDAQYLFYDFTVSGASYMDAVFTPGEGGDEANAKISLTELGDGALRTGNYRGYLPLVGKANTALAAFKNLHVVIEAGTVTFNDMALVTLKQVPDEIVINGMVYTVDQTVADKAALGIPDAAMNASADVGAETPVSCGDAQYLFYDFTVSGASYMDAVFTPGEGGDEANAKISLTELGEGVLRTGNYRGYLPLVGKANTALAAFKNLHVVIEAGTVTFNDMALVTMKEKVTENTPDPGPGPEPEPEGKKVQFNLLPQASGWSGESTLVPEAAENGWILKAAEGTEGGNAIGYFGTTYKEGWLLAYDFTIASGNATINMSFIRGLQDSEYPGGAPDYCLSKAIAAQHGIATVGTEKTSLPAGTYKGVLDLSEVFEGFDGFDKFQHIGVYMGGTTMTFRELAFVTGVEAGVDKPDDGKDDGGDKPATGSALPVAAAGLTVLAAGALLLSRKKG